MPVTNHTIEVLIDSVDKTDFLLKEALYITLPINNRSSSAELRFKDYSPPERSEVLININGTAVFGGYIVRKEVAIKGVKGQHFLEYTCACKDYSDLLETIQMSANYSAFSDSAIVQNIFISYLSSYSFDTSTDVATLDPDLDISFENISIRDALDMLASRTGANWYIKPNKSVYWFSPKNPQSAAFIISSSPNDSTSFGFVDNSLSYSIDATTIINKVTISGGLKTSDTKQTDSIIAQASKAQKLTKIPASFQSVQYTTNLGSYVSYGSFVGFEDQGDKLISDGGTYRVVASQANKTISMEGNSNEPPVTGSTITVEYYYKEEINYSIADLSSIIEYGTFPLVLYNEEYASADDAEKYARNLLEKNSRGKSTLKFDTFKHGLLPGQVLEVDIPELNLDSTTNENILDLQNDDDLLLESGNSLLLEQYSVSQFFVIQEIRIQPIRTNDGFLLIASISCGEYIPNILDTLSTISEVKSQAGKQLHKSSPVKLSNVSADMGEIRVGRANFTDGGTASFSWGTPNGATGVVIGLEDTSSLRGNLSIFQSGTVKAKLGRLDDLPSFNGIQPVGWGLFTDNGYFKGTVGASQVTGGTITGNLIQGGTVTGSLVSGGTVTGNLVSGGTVTGAIIIGGTIATSTPPINSSNTGVYMDSTGLYGYGTVGLVFRLSSDPAIKPWFSSGTILNTVYEINTAAILRTGTTDPRIQIDNSGIFAYDSGGNLRFTVDVATGRLTANQGTFSGTVSASAINTSTLTTSTLTANNITSGTISGNVLNANNLNSGTITGNTITGNTISANNISGGTITGVVVTANNISGGTVSGALVSGNTISGGTITGALISGNTVSGGTVTGALVSAVGGSVSISGVGMNIIAPTSYGFGDAQHIKWTTGGTVIGEVSGAWVSSVSYLRLIAGKFADKTGEVQIIAYKSSGNGSSFVLNTTSSSLAVGGNGIFTTDTSLMYMQTNLVPDATANNRQLGDSSHAFKYLYLKDDAGVTRRVSINSSGVLTVT